MKLDALVMSMLVASCGGGSPQSSAPAAPAPSAAAMEPAATADPLHVALGEATVVELGATEQPMLKLHTNGQLEAAFPSKHGPATWYPAGTLHTDGSIVGGTSEITLRDEYDNVPTGNYQVAKRVSGNTIAIDIAGLPTATFTLAPDGNISLDGRTPPRRWRVTASSPEVARTAFLVFGTMVRSRID